MSFDKAKFFEGLAKAVSGLSEHFHKAAAHHDGLHKAHAEMSAYAKAKHEASDDGDVHKAFLGKTAEHHAAKAALHKAHHEHLKAMAAECDKSLKAAGTEGTVENPTTKTVQPVEPAATAAPANPAAEAAEGVKGMMDTTVAALVAKALASLKDDPKVAEEIQKILLEQVQLALGNKLVPSDVRGVLPNAVMDPRAQLIPRAGQPVVDTATVDPEFASLFEVSST